MTGNAFTFSVAPGRQANEAVAREEGTKRRKRATERDFQHLLAASQANLPVEPLQPKALLVSKKEFHLRLKGQKSGAGHGTPVNDKKGKRILANEKLQRLLRNFKVESSEKFRGAGKTAAKTVKPAGGLLKNNEADEARFSPEARPGRNAAVKSLNSSVQALVKELQGKGIDVGSLKVRVSQKDDTTQATGEMLLHQRKQMRKKQRVHAKGEAQAARDSGHKFAKAAAAANETTLQEKLKAAAGQSERNLTGSFAQIQHGMQQNGDLQGLKAGSPLPMTSAQMLETIEKITELVKAQGHFAGQKLGVQMDVRDLGQVVVDATRQAEKVHLQIQVDNHDARRFMEGQLKPLAEQLARDGIDLGKLDVSVRDQRSEGQFSEPQPRRFGHSGQRREPGLAESLGGRWSDRNLSGLRSRKTGTQTVEIWA